MSRGALSLDALERGVLAGDRAILARAITLVESSAVGDRALAQQLLHRVLPHAGGARRVGITGVPGAGKSTLIDVLGVRLVEEGHKVAVLAIDPTSVVSGGSILGDKTRMGALSLEPRAYIRPSPSGLSPGGVARRTREAMLLCEAAGFDVVLIETVGVGQGEVAVSALVDFSLVLLLAGAGDELQGIKRGVLELADAVAINKADGDNVTRARTALLELRSALRILPPRHASWKPQVLALSAVQAVGLESLWQAVEDQHAALSASGELAALRSRQQLQWMWSLVTERLDTSFREHAGVATVLAAIEADVAAGRETPDAAAERLLALFRA